MENHTPKITEDPKTQRKSLKKLTEAKITKNDIIGFADEMGGEANPNTVKL